MLNGRGTMQGSSEQSPFGCRYQCFRPARERENVFLAFDIPIYPGPYLTKTPITIAKYTLTMVPSGTQIWESDLGTASYLCDLHSITSVIFLPSLAIGCRYQLERKARKARKADKCAILVIISSFPRALGLVRIIPGGGGNQCQRLSKGHVSKSLSGFGAGPLHVLWFSACCLW